jgi:hypothetical protein
MRTYQRITGNAKSQSSSPSFLPVVVSITCTLVDGRRSTKSEDDDSENRRNLLILLLAENRYDDDDCLWIVHQTSEANKKYLSVPSTLFAERDKDTVE